MVILTFCYVSLPLDGPAKSSHYSIDMKRAQARLSIMSPYVESRLGSNFTYQRTWLACVPPWKSEEDQKERVCDLMSGHLFVYC